MGKTILVVDDNPTVRRLIREQLEASGLRVCGEAVDGVDAIEKVQVLSPDLIILDVAMPRMNGLDAAREISKIRPDVTIILNTLHAEAIRSDPKLPAGVRAIVSKTENLADQVMMLLGRGNGLQNKRSAAGY
jgi:two-component system, chemotaxis family, chemotaxis protein CheY